MDRELENEVESDIHLVTVNGHESVPAEIFASDHAEETSVKSFETVHFKEADTLKKEENIMNELADNDHIKTEPLPLEESVVFGMDCNDDKPRLNLETLKKEDIVVPADKEVINFNEYIQLLQELCEEKNEGSQRGSQLQMELAEFFHKKAWDDVQLEMKLPWLQLLQEYERHMTILNYLKQKLKIDSEISQQQTEKMNLQSNEKLTKVKNEWQAFMALKQDVAVTVLSWRLGKQISQAKVESVLSADQLRQDELIELHLKNIMLRMKIHRLDVDLRDEEEHTTDLVQVQFEQLQAERLELKKHAEKQSEESVKMQKKISSSLEVLSNLKEKLFWSHTHVQARCEQLATIASIVARKKDFLTRTKQACSSLQRGNLKLKMSCGLQGNRMLLQDFECTVDASNQLEEQLEKKKDLK